jgi:hypothetical protein
MIIQPEGDNSRQRAANYFLGQAGILQKIKNKYLLMSVCF